MRINDVHLHSAAYFACRAVLRESSKPPFLALFLILPSPRTHPSPTLPPHSAHPLNPTLHILPLHQTLHGKVLPRQLLITSNAVHKTMTSPAQPRDAVQPLFGMPPPLPHLVVNAPGNEMVVRQRYPVALA